MKVTDIEDWIEAHGPAGTGEIHEQTPVYVEDDHADFDFHLEVEEHNGENFVLIVVHHGN